MKIIRWWVEPGLDSESWKPLLHGGYSSSVGAARKAARDLLGMHSRQSFGAAGYSFRFELLQMEGRKSEVIKELNWAVNYGLGGNGYEQRA